jgi:hypothetical protein
MRFILLFVCLCFVHTAIGQGTRELIDLNDLAPKPVQPVPIPTPSSPASPPRTLPTAVPGLPNWNTPLLNAPAISINSEMEKRLMESSKNTPAADTSLSAPPSSVNEQNKPLTNKAAMVFEEETTDDREKRELLIQRRRAEQIADPERQKTELEQVERNETALQSRLTRRQTDETGANLFYFPRLKEQLLKTGWCQLFDGHTGFGWKVQTEGYYAEKGGKFTFGQNEIVSDPYHPGLIYTQIPFGDASLRFDYWAEKDSEILLLMMTPPDPDDLYTSCYTFVLNSSKSSRPRGLLLGRQEQSFAELRAMRETRDDPDNQEEGTWHSALVKTDGSDIQISIDGRSALTYFVPQPIPSGHIAFLTAKGKARFQNVLWLPHQAIAIFSTENVIGDVPWNIFDGSDFVGSDESKYHLFSGSVESKKIYGNYVLQMQYFQGLASGRSSLFLRSLPGRENTGYEISLQNFPRRQDRTTARGVDAGGFLQIKDARYIRTQDQQWTYLTAVVMDRQIQTWINGVPVCEIYDQRKVPEGMPLDRQRHPFLQPGTIRLSVPTDNTGFQFRQLMVSPIQQ